MVNREERPTARISSRKIPVSSSSMKNKVYILGDPHSIPINVGTEIYAKAGKFYDRNEMLASFDPWFEPILTEVSRQGEFVDIELNKSLREEIDPSPTYQAGHRGIQDREAPAADRHHRSVQARTDHLPAAQGRPPHGRERRQGIAGDHPGEDPARR